MAVAVTEAIPLAFVVAVPADSTADAPEPGAANVTVTPGTGFELASRTVTCSALAKAVPTNTDCGVPAVGATEEGPAGELTSANSMGGETPTAEAETLYEPMAEPAVAVTEAMPPALVDAVDADNTAVAPAAGGVNVTAVPWTGLPRASFTETCSAAPKAVLTLAVCGPPPTSSSCAGGPAVLVSENTAPNATPAADTVTS